jgi:hypothetical protein
MAHYLDTSSVLILHVVLGTTRNALELGFMHFRVQNNLQKNVMLSYDYLTPGNHVS